MAERIAPAAMKAMRGPQVPDMYPSQGLRCTFRGPTARAAFSAGQLIRVNETMWEKTRAIVESFQEQYGPDAAIKVWGISAGTRDAVVAASRIGEMLGRPVDDCTVISPGTSMGLGIFAAWPVSPAAEELRRQGYTPQSFHEATYQTSQEAALEGAHLPAGRNLKVVYGTHDTIVPASLTGGSKDFIALARKRGLAPTVIEYKGLDHVTLPGEILWQKAYGNDPTFEHNRPSVWSIPETYSDPRCIRMLNDIFSRFSAEEIPFFAEEVSAHNGATVESEMDPYVHALAHWLLKHEVCMMMTGPRYLYVRDKEEKIDKVDHSLKRFRERIVRKEFPKILRELRALDHDPDFKPLYEMSGEEKKLKIIDEGRAS
jgi:hypothetical protein